MRISAIQSAKIVAKILSIMLSSHHCMKKVALIALIGVWSTLLLSVSCRSGPRILWKYKTGGKVYSSPSISGNLLVIGSSDLYGLDLQTGKEIWKHNLGGRIISKPLVMKDTMYVGAGTYLYALDSQRGTTRWRIKTDGDVEYDPCTDGSAIYFGNGKGQFYRVNADGKKVWQFTTRDAFTSSCAIYNDLVIAGSWDHNIYAWNRNTGNVVWTHNSGVIHYGAPEILGDKLYIATHNDFYKMDAATGKVFLKRKTLYLNHLIIVNNHIWTNEKGLSKRDLDGNVLASVDFKPFSHFRPVFGDGMFVVSGVGNSLFGISPDLKLLWKHKEEGTFWSPGVIQNKVYYTGNRNSYVYALSLAR